MDEQWAGVRTKLERAVEHLAGLDAAIAAFLNAQPHPFAVHIRADGDALIYSVEVREAPPAQLGALVGDALHNARSALDHLAWAAADPAHRSRRTAFPVVDDESRLEEAARSSLAGTPGAFVDAVIALRPSPSGDVDLWRLHRLDIVDKHRLLVPVAASWSQMSAGIPGVLELQMTVEATYPLETGTELLRIPGGKALPSELLPVPRFDLVLHEPDVVGAEPVIPLLTRLIDRASDVARDLTGQDMPKAS